MIACIDNTVIDSKKFMLLPVLARHLYLEFSTHCDKRGAMSVEQFDDLIIISGASILEKALLINQGFILFNEIEEKFYLDAYFHVHNRNLEKKYQRSNFSPLIDKYYFESPYSHILTKKVNEIVPTTSQISTNKSIQFNLTQSQYLNINTSDEDLNSESAKNEALRQQNINPETEDLNSESAETLRQVQDFNLESAKEKFKDSYSEAEIVEAFFRMEKMPKIRNKWAYIKKVLFTNKNKPKTNPQKEPEKLKKNEIPNICTECEHNGHYPCVKLGSFQVYTNGTDTGPCPYAKEGS